MGRRADARGSGMNRLRQTSAPTHWRLNPRQTRGIARNDERPRRLLAVKSNRRLQQSQAPLTSAHFANCVCSAMVSAIRACVFVLKRRNASCAPAARTYTLRDNVGKWNQGQASVVATDVNPVGAAWCNLVGLTPRLAGISAAAARASEREDGSFGSLPLGSLQIRPPVKRRQIEIDVPAREVSPAHSAAFPAAS